MDVTPNQLTGVVKFYSQNKYGHEELISLLYVKEDMADKKLVSEGAPQRRVRGRNVEPDTFS